MPNWKTHIEISNRLKNFLRYNDKDFDLFTFGSILPDINNCYLVPDISKKIDHIKTHFSTTSEKSYINFYNKYKKYIDRPLVFGYFTHLYTDYSWNNNFYTNVKKSKFSETPHNELRQMKQDDFKIYNSKFSDNSIKIDHILSFLNESKIITEVSIVEDDILKVKHFLDTKEIFQNKLQFYKTEELDKLTDDTVNKIKENYIV